MVWRLGQLTKQEISMAELEPKTRYEKRILRFLTKKRGEKGRLDNNPLECWGKALIWEQSLRAQYVVKL